MLRLAPRDQVDVKAKVYGMATTARVWFSVVGMVTSGGLVLVGCGEPGVTAVTCVADPSTVGGAGSGADSPVMSDGPVAPLPCPAGYECRDLAALGAISTDQAGNPFMATCSKGGQTPCDDANPAASCPDLPNAICAHVSIAGMNLVSCGQVCTP